MTHDKPKKEPGRYWLGVRKADENMWVKVSIDGVELMFTWNDEGQPDDLIKEALEWVPRAIKDARLERQALIISEDLDADIQKLLGDDDDE